MLVMLDASEIRMEPDIASRQPAKPVWQIPFALSKNSNEMTLYSTLLFPVSRLTHPRRRLDTHCLSTPDVVSRVN
jgi:hypothetical protein